MSQCNIFTDPGIATIRATVCEDVNHLLKDSRVDTMMIAANEADNSAHDLLRFYHLKAFEMHGGSITSDNNATLVLKPGMRC